jgi:hypothetical protein
VLCHGAAPGHVKYPEHHMIRLPVLEQPPVLSPGRCTPDVPPEEPINPVIIARFPSVSAGRVGPCGNGSLTARAKVSATVIPSHAAP